MLALDNELVLLAHVPRAEELLVVLAVKQRCLVSIQSSLACRFWKERGKSEANFQRKGSKHTVVSRAADKGKPLRVLEAKVEGELALGRRDHVRVGQAHLQLQVVLCFVAKTIPGMLTPRPLAWVLYWLLWILGPEDPSCWRWKSKRERDATDQKKHIRKLHRAGWGCHF